LFNVYKYNKKIEANFKISDLVIKDKYLIYDYIDKKIIKGDEISTKLLQREVKYYILSPIKKDKAIIGDLGKFITCSKKRINYINIEKNKIKFKLFGIKNTESTFGIYTKSSPKAIYCNGFKLKKYNSLSDLKKSKNSCWFYLEDIVYLKINFKKQKEVSLKIDF
jgi:hypothetical protein